MAGGGGGKEKETLFSDGVFRSRDLLRNKPPPACLPSCGIDTDDGVALIDAAEERLAATSCRSATDADTENSPRLGSLADGDLGLPATAVEGMSSVVFGFFFFLSEDPAEKTPMRSIGTGNTMVVFFSVPMVFNVYECKC